MTVLVTAIGTKECQHPQNLILRNITLESAIQIMYDYQVAILLVQKVYNTWFCLLQGVI